MEAKIENKEDLSYPKSGKGDINIVKSVCTLRYDQPADVTIRKMLGLTFIFKVERMSLFDSEREECAIAS